MILIVFCHLQGGNESALKSSDHQIGQKVSSEQEERRRAAYKVFEHQRSVTIKVIQEAQSLGHYLFSLCELVVFKFWFV